MSATSSIEAEYNEIDQGKNWEITFDNLRQKSATSFTYDEAKKHENRKLNRYRDVNPYDHSRIKLKRGSVDYINANLVELKKVDRRYILTQGPLPATLEHFWLMVWEQESIVILMLNKIIEKNQIKCHMYWPENCGSDTQMEMEEVGLKLEYLHCEEYKHYLKRTFRLTDVESSESREIIQFHYMTWPDFGIPSSPIAFLQFLNAVRDSGGLGVNVGPPIVHCSAGIGRSGTFCVVDCCLALIDKEGEENVSIQDVLLELRRYRMGLIQTVDQLIFSYQAIIEGIKHLNDPNFIKYEAETNDGCEDEEEGPPPLPPKRTISLGNSNQTEFIMHGFLGSERELPPIPPFNEDDEIDEDSINSSDSDSEVDEIDECDSEPEEDDSKFHNNILNGYDRSNNDERNMQPEVSENLDNDGNESLEPPSPKKQKQSDSPNNIGIMKLPEETETKLTGSSELRRRKRIEYLSELDKKVKEMKRKQEECEETYASKKKRSTLIKIAAGVGVVIGLICIYSVYSK